MTTSSLHALADERAAARCQARPAMAFRATRRLRADRLDGPPGASAQGSSRSAFT